MVHDTFSEGGYGLVPMCGGSHAISLGSALLGIEPNFHRVGISLSISAGAKTDHRSTIPERKFLHGRCDDETASPSGHESEWPGELYVIRSTSNLGPATRSRSPLANTAYPLTHLSSGSAKGTAFAPVG